MRVIGEFAEEKNNLCETFQKMVDQTLSHHQYLPPFVSSLSKILFGGFTPKQRINRCLQ
jgi:hypothetical protein